VAREHPLEFTSHQIRGAIEQKASSHLLSKLFMGNNFTQPKLTRKRRCGATAARQIPNLKAAGSNPVIFTHSQYYSVLPIQILQWYKSCDTNHHSFVATNNLTFVGVDGGSSDVFNDEVSRTHASSPYEHVALDMVFGGVNTSEMYAKLGIESKDCKHDHAYGTVLCCWSNR
jgi:hypothetical protein